MHNANALSMTWSSSALKKLWSAQYGNVGANYALVGGTVAVLGLGGISQVGTGIEANVSERAEAEPMSIGSDSRAASSGAFDGFGSGGDSRGNGGGSGADGSGAGDVASIFREPLIFDQVPDNRPELVDPPAGSESEVGSSGAVNGGAGTGGNAATVGGVTSTQSCSGLRCAWELARDIMAGEGGFADRLGSAASKLGRAGVATFVTGTEVTEQSLGGRPLWNYSAEELVERSLITVGGSNGHLEHRVDRLFNRMSSMAKEAALDRMDREAWAADPSGTKPAAAWNQGDALQALFSNPNHLWPGEGTPLANAPDHLTGYGKLPEYTSELLQQSLDKIESDRQQYNGWLGSLEKLSGFGDYSETADAIREALAAGETLEFWRKIQLDSALWSEQREAMLANVPRGLLDPSVDGELDADAIHASMGDLDADVLAMIREMERTGEPPMRDGKPIPFEELMFALLEDGSHDASVQLVLEQYARYFNDRAAAAAAQINAPSLASVIADLEAQAKAKIAPHAGIVDSYKAASSKRDKLLKSQKALHAKGENDGLTKAEWREYQTIAGQIRGLTNEINGYAGQSADLRNGLASFNQQVSGSGIAGYAAPNMPGELAQVSNPSFFSSRPLPPKKPTPRKKPVAHARVSNPSSNSSRRMGGREVVAFHRGNQFTIRVVDIGGKPVEIETAKAYKRMAAAAAADGVNLQVVSGYRTNEKQEYLYGCYINKNCNSGNKAARPKYSEHQSGHALDLNSHDRRSAQYRWLANNAHRFGFRETVAGEPWHWEWW